MTFRDQLIADASVFTETDEFAEVIEFAPDGTTFGDVDAQVFRQPRDAVQSDRNVAYGNTALVYIRKADVTGQVNDKAAKVKFTALEGDAAKVTWAVTEIHDRDDPALWKLTVQQ